MRCAILLVPALMLAALPLPAQSRFQEKVEVRRIIIDAYITDALGHPIEGLTPDDLEVTVGGRAAEIDAVDWIPMATTSNYPATVEGSPAPAARRGRLIVLFFQTDFARNRARLHGQMAVIPQAVKFLDSLESTDLVAVVQFDSHLKIRCDFTNHRDVLERMIEHSLALDETEPVRPTAYASLLDELDPHELRDAANPERALYVIAKALANIEGAKTLVVFGYGLGVYTKGMVSMRVDYEKARAMLEEARTTVFSLDVTEADYHTLEVGLQKVAGDTGGFYARTFRFPTIAMERLENTLSGRYEIVLKPDGIAPGRQPVEVRVHRRGAEVRVPSSITIRP